MLVLTRKIDEEIKVGPDVSIKILAISENQIKIGIEAPKHIQIFRSEVYNRVRETTKEASSASNQKQSDLLKYKIRKVKE